MSLVLLRFHTNYFSSRYFFKLKLLLRGAANPLDVLDDDENLDWETNDPVSECAAFVTDADSVPPPRAVGSEASLSSLTPDPEKDLMRKQIRVLVARVSELEKALTEAKNELKLYDSKDRVDAAGASGAVCAPPAPPSLPSPEIPPSEPSPTSDVPDGSVIERGSSAMSRFENETSTDNSNHGVSPKASQKSKSEVSLANLDDEWDEENSWS